MNPTRTFQTAAILVAIVVAACTSGGGVTGAGPTGSPRPTAATASPAASPSPAATGGGPSATPVAGTPGVVIDRAWATAALTDVETGEAFRIADFAGRTTFVEAMAIWCTTCRRQQGEFKEALSQLDPASVAYVVLTVDPSETADQLRRYEADRAFEGRYAVAGREVSAALEADFGSTVLIPPAVPLITIAPDGSIEFTTGPHTAAEIVDVVRAHGG